MQIAHDVQCLLRVHRPFHVDAGEVLQPSGMCDELIDDLERELLGDVQAHVGQLHADVRVELSRGDLIEELVIERSAFAGLGGIRDVFAEVVDGHAHAGSVDGLSGADRVSDFSTCDEACGDAAA